MRYKLCLLDERRYNYRDDFLSNDLRRIYRSLRSEVESIPICDIEPSSDFEPSIDREEVFSRFAFSAHARFETMILLQACQILSMID